MADLLFSFERNQALATKAWFGTGCLIAITVWSGKK